MTDNWHFVKLWAAGVIAVGSQVVYYWHEFVEPVTLQEGVTAAVMIGAWCAMLFRVWEWSRGA